MHHSRNLRLAGVAAAFLLASLSASAQVDVKHDVGALHGFLTIHSQTGIYLGYGEVTTTAVGDLATVHLVYHFRDGSLDDETTTFTQRKTFQFVSDHHIQQGPFFPKPSDTTVEANGQVTIRSIDKDGKPKVETQHMDIPPGFSNGMVGTILQNISSDASESRLGMIVPDGSKGRAINLNITPSGQQSFRIAGTARKATVFRIKIDLGGIASVVAPLIGKQPGDTYISVLQGEPPTIVRIVGPLATGTPTLDIQLAGTTFPKNSSSAPTPAK